MYEERYVERPDQFLSFKIKIWKYLFSETMGKSRFCEIIRFLQFDMRSTRLNDKFK